MANNRNDKLQGTWAEDATVVDVTPASPIIGTAYRLTTADVTKGAQFRTKNPSEDINQYLYTVSKLLDQLQNLGCLGWNNTTSYLAGAIAVGSDGGLYMALLDGINKDPITETTYWTLVATRAYVDAGLAARALTTLANITTTPIVANSTANTTPDVVVESWVATGGLSWYRKWKSGWIQQGGVTSSFTSTGITVTLPIAFTATTYSVLFSSSGRTSSTIDVYYSATYGFTLTSFKIKNSSAATNSGFWIAEGF